MEFVGRKTALFFHLYVALKNCSKAVPVHSSLRAQDVLLRTWLKPQLENTREGVLRRSKGGVICDFEQDPAPPPSYVCYSSFVPTHAALLSYTALSSLLCSVSLNGKR